MSRLYVCPECNRINPIQNRFCGECGASLEGAHVVQQVKDKTPPPKADRKEAPPPKVQRKKAPPPKAQRKKAPPPSERKKGGAGRTLLVAGLLLVGACVGAYVLGGVIQIFQNQESVGNHAAENASATQVATTPKPASTLQPTESPTPTKTPSPTKTPEPTATVRPVAPSYSKIRDTVQDMTEAQWKPYLRRLEGNRILGWQGWVVDVDVSLLGKYELWVDMDSPDDLLSTQDVYFEVPEEVALSLQKGQMVVFSGWIKRASEFLGSPSFEIEDVKLKY